MKDCLKLTVVLTLKDRAPFTYRWMAYMNDMRCQYRILIADGGEEGSAIEQHLRSHEHYPHLDYEYLRYPYDATIEHYFKKLENVISLVESEYLLLADNDDFYLLERVPDILAFLDTQKDYVGARGQLVDFSLFDKNGLSKVSSGLWYVALPNEAPSIESASPFERVEGLCRDMSKYFYYANWYCIFRSAALQDVWKSLITLPTREVVVTEMLTNILMAVRGKIRIFPYLFYIRQIGTSMHDYTLRVGNEFSDRRMVNNALSEFALAVDRFSSVINREEKDRMLRAIAAWLEALVSGIHSNRLHDKTSFMFRLREGMKRSSILGPWAYWLYYRIAHLFLPLRRHSPVRVKAIEPYILS